MNYGLTIRRPSKKDRHHQRDMHRSFEFRDMIFDIAVGAGGTMGACIQGFAKQRRALFVFSGSTPLA